MDTRNQISIDGWQIDAGSYRITRDGIEKKLEPRGMELLLYLAARPGEVVTRQEIEDNVWKDRVVGYDALSGTIAKIRKTFADTDKSHRIIETIPKAGYRLIAQVLVIAKQEDHLPEQPAGENFERKLAAIFYADVAGYSRLTGEDEDRTHHQLRSNMKTISESIVGFQGRVIHYAGDAVLADFSTASMAVHCALEVQQKISDINSHLPENQQVLFRIGVNLGEVIVDGDEIYGDGVNVAARLEGLAEPGGTCISGAVFDAIGQKQNFDFEFHGEKSVKNILRPIRTYSVHLKQGASIPVPEPVKKQAGPRQPPEIAVSMQTGLIVLAIVVAGFIIFQSTRQETGSDPINTEYFDSVLPSLAILPFRNTSNNPAQTVYSDGLTDDLITDLSNIDGLRVTPRHSSFLYQDSDSSVQDIASELRVRYIVQGSVRRSQQNIRINIQLVDAKTNQQVWAQRFDDNIENLFLLQDQVISEILAKLNLKTGKKAAAIRRSNNLEAYDYFLRAEHLRLLGIDSTRDTESIQLYQKAIDLDPQFVAAYTGLAREALTNWQLDASQVMPAAASRKLVYQTAGKALELDPENTEALAILGLIQTISGAHDTGVASVRRAVAIDSKNPQLNADLAEVLSYSGLHEEALDMINKAIRSHVTPPPYFFRVRADIYFFLREFKKALDDLDNIGNLRKVRNFKIPVYGALNDPESAKPLLDTLFEEVAWFNLEYYRTSSAYYRRTEDIDLLIESYAKAGMPRFAYGYDPGDNQALDDTEIQVLVNQGLWYGSTYNRREFYQQFSGSDAVAIRTPDAMMSGNYHIESGKLCVTYRSVLLDLPDCGYIYPDGDANQYTWVTLGEVYTFSIK